MAKQGFSAASLHILNAFILILSLAIAATSLWFYIQVLELTGLRNPDHYRLDYHVYWPQAIPWMFIVVSVLVIIVSGCGFSGARKRSRGLLLVFVVCSSLAVVALLAAAIIALVFAESHTTEDFLRDSIWDAFRESKANKDIESAYGNIERKLQCCGADSPRNYKGWKDVLPVSCCDTYYHAWGQENYFINCDFTNKLANERHGCTTVAFQYLRIIIKVLSGAAIIVALLKLIALSVAVSMLKALRPQTHILVPQHESDSKKGLL